MLAAEMNIIIIVYFVNFSKVTSWISVNYLRTAWCRLIIILLFFSVVQVFTRTQLLAHVHNLYSTCITSRSWESVWRFDLPVSPVIIISPLSSSGYTYVNNIGTWHVTTKPPVGSSTGHTCNYDIIKYIRIQMNNFASSQT